MKKTLLLATGALMAAGFAVDANAVDVELYGQVNKVAVSTDNGTSTETTFNDNDKSSTRVGLKGEQALDNGLTASVLVEYELNTDTSNADLMTTTSSTASTLTERHARVGIAGDFGAVFVGHTSTATDGIYEIDLAGASDLMGSSFNKIGGGTAFAQKSGTTAAQTVNSSFTNFDGGRADLVAYHSPVVSGFQGQLTTSEGGDIQAAVRYSGKYDAFAVKAGLGYEMNEDRTTAATDEAKLAGSISVKHDSGIAGTVAYGQANNENGAEASTVYVKAGYAFDAFEVAVDFAKSEADDALNTEGKSFGIGGQYNLGHGVSLAAAYRTMEVEKDAANYDDIDQIMANLRVKF
ncbi:MAG: putative porin [Alphaproteobacteria bacterium]|jgi:predicted porin